MKKSQILALKLDSYQKRHRGLSFIVAVIMKYNEDEAGRQAALLTYYSFLTLFPMLLVLTTLTDRIVGHNPHIETTVIHGVTNYFPLLGNQLASHVHELHSSSDLALVSGILFVLYGIHGVSYTFTSGVRRVWGVPTKRHDTFLKSTLKSLCLAIIGGLGLIFASVSAGLAASVGSGWAIRSLSVLINLIIIFCMFMFLINFSLPRHVSIKEIRIGAAAATLGLVILQTLGSYVLVRELKHLDALYSYFALALGLLFWLYLQTQVFFYAIEISVVNSQKRWPRSLT